MSSFRDDEKLRQNSVASQLFSADAARLQGKYSGRPRPFCLPEVHSAENLHESLRQSAIDYFDKRAIKWHDGIRISGLSQEQPSNHLCCSQSFCVNSLFPFRSDKAATTALLKALGYADVDEALPIVDDHGEGDGYVAFEWIGRKNYLGEGRGGKPTPDEQRTRGANSTSADFLLRYRTLKNTSHVVVGEWKYTEMYSLNTNIRWSAGGTDRLATYGPHLGRSGLLQKTGILSEALFFEPFYQLMRLQLLAFEMKRARELDADTVSVLHVARRRIENSWSESLRPIWPTLVPMYTKSGRRWHPVVGSKGSRPKPSSMGPRAQLSQRAPSIGRSG